MKRIKPVIVWKVRPNNYVLLVRKGKQVLICLTGNSFFNNPIVSLTALASAILDVETAMAKYGSTGTRGSEADYKDLLAKSKTLFNLLVSLGQWVQASSQLTAQNDYEVMAAMISTSGYEIKNPPTPQGLLEPVRNLRRVLDPALNLNECKGKWEAPINVTSKGNVHAFRINRGITPVFAESMQIAVVTKAEFIDSNPNAAPGTFYYWVIPIGAAGEGSVSAPLQVFLAGATL